MQAYGVRWQFYTENTINTCSLTIVGVFYILYEASICVREI